MPNLLFRVSFLWGFLREAFSGKRHAYTRAIAHTHTSWPWIRPTTSFHHTANEAEGTEWAKRYGGAIWWYRKESGRQHTHVKGAEYVHERLFKPLWNLDVSSDSAFENINMKFWEWHSRRNPWSLNTTKRSASRSFGLASSAPVCVCVRVTNSFIRSIHQHPLSHHCTKTIYQTS